jgi:hypothetical protein
MCAAGAGALAPAPGKRADGGPVLALGPLSIDVERSEAVAEHAADSQLGALLRMLLFIAAVRSTRTGRSSSSGRIEA